MDSKSLNNFDDEYIITFYMDVMHTTFNTKEKALVEGNCFGYENSSLANVIITRLHKVLVLISDDDPNDS